MLVYSLLWVAAAVLLGWFAIVIIPSMLFKPLAITKEVGNSTESLVPIRASPSPLRSAQLLLLERHQSGTERRAAAERATKAKFNNYTGLKNFTGKLVWKHLPKAGGNFVKHVFKFLFAAEEQLDSKYPEMAPTVKRVSEFTPLHMAIFSGGFKIGLMREPCQMYQSLWSFCFLGSRHPSRYGGPICRNARIAPILANATNLGDTTKFSEFVATLRTNDGQAGFATCRVHYSYLHKGYHCSDLHPYFLTVPGKRYKDSFKKKDGKKAADCWVYTESLESDLKTCLQEFEKTTGRSAHLGNYDKAVKYAHHKRENSIEEHLKMASTVDQPHECSYYFDVHLSKLVESMDSAIYDTWGYRGCCSSDHDR